MTPLAKCFTCMMPKKLRKLNFSNRKAKTLTALHIIFLLFSTIYIFLSQSVTEPSAIPVFLPLLGTLALVILFKKVGNLSLSGNLACFLYFGILSTAAYSSGGLYSDDLVWASITPVFAFLVINKRMGFFWLFAFCICTGVYYYLEINSLISFREKTELFEPIYFFISWILLVSVLSGVVYVYTQNETEMVQSLLKNKKELIKQGEELRKQTEILRQKEQQLLKLNANLEHYAHAISHDLREPLRTVKSYTQLLNRSLGNKLGDKDGLYMDFVLSGTDRMVHLLEDLLEFSRISEVNHEFVPVNLNDVVLLVVNNLNRKVRESGASITVEENLPLVKGTQSLLVIVIQNLVANAIKFRHVNREPKVNIYHKKEADRVVICVEDNGIGVAADYKEKVFELFNRLHTREKYDGSGIGLTTCGKIINSLGGEIWLESELGEGTTFMFSVPNTIEETVNANYENAVF